MTTYEQQVHCRAADIDIDFWRTPEGVAIPDDELRFLLVPDTVEAMMVGEVAEQIKAFQQSANEPITRALMVTMGGLLPGILLHDHLVHMPSAPHIAFGSIGVSLYTGPDQRRPKPQVVQESSLEVRDEVVILVDDLGDRGDTLRFLSEHITERGARRVMSLALFMKPRAKTVCPANFYFGELTQDTWIITPREYVETMAKRIPVWKQRGATQAECQRRLVDLIGYPPHLVDTYLETLFEQG
ncbi:phosphoribosyltransferase [Candidatus Marimicrobium litorale]|nr:phosphoribosyltransferase family protein [Candidatus Marimicrobium litorale]